MEQRKITNNKLSRQFILFHLLYRLCTVLIINVLLIHAILRYKTVRLGMQNGPFRKQKRTVWEVEMICLGMV